MIGQMGDILLQVTPGNASDHQINKKTGTRQVTGMFFQYSISII